MAYIRLSAAHCDVMNNGKVTNRVFLLSVASSSSTMMMIKGGSAYTDLRALHSRAAAELVSVDSAD